MNTKHTPTPWVITDKHVPVTLQDFPDQSVHFDSIEALGYVAGGGIALVHRKPGVSNYNADFIVLACNLHDDLVAALAAGLVNWHANEKNFYKKEPAWIKNARVALAKDKGG